jgi:hypothetical protein
LLKRDAVKRGRPHLHSGRGSRRREAKGGRELATAWRRAPAHPLSSADRIARSAPEWDGVRGVTIIVGNNEMQNLGGKSWAIMKCHMKDMASASVPLATKKLNGIGLEYAQDLLCGIRWTEGPRELCTAERAGRCETGPLEETSEMGACVVASEAGEAGGVEGVGAYAAIGLRLVLFYVIKLCQEQGNSRT